MLFRKPSRPRKAGRKSSHVPGIESVEERLLLSAVTAQTADLTDSADQDAAAEEAASLSAAAAAEALSSDAAETDSERSDDAAVAESDVVLDWNNVFGELLVADEVNQNPGYASRSMAMLNVAIYDAVTLVLGDSADTFYEYSDAIIDLASGLSADIAASQAASTVLSSLYPDQQAIIDAFADSVLTGYAGTADAADSIALGTAVGDSIIAARADDGSDVVVDYEFTDDVGYFQADPLNPDVPVWGPGWGDVETFAISSTDDFVPETTPALTSEEYAAAYNEVRELGSVDSTVRTADQTEIGIFWAYDSVGQGTPLSLYNDVLETIAVQQGNTLEENAALFAQASVAMADAAIVAWDTKFSEEFWRPVTAIHDGDLDGNPLTEGDAAWTALGAPDGGDDIVGFTPQFPTYISGHATFGGALFGTLQEFYGTDDISFELTSAELELLLDDPELQEAYGLNLDDATRSFDSLSEAMAENGRSRVYLGIHFNFDDLVGQEVGQAVAGAVAADFAVPNSSDSGSTTLSIDLAQVDAGDVSVRAADGNLEVVDNRTHSVISSQPLAETERVTIAGRDGQADRITVENLTASDLPGGIAIDGGDGRGDTLFVRGTDAADSVVVGNSAIDVNGLSVEVEGLQRVVIESTPGVDTVEVSDDVSFNVSIVGGRKADNGRREQHRSGGEREDGRRVQRSDQRGTDRGTSQRRTADPRTSRTGTQQNATSPPDSPRRNATDADSRDTLEAFDRLFASGDIGEMLDGPGR